jgi:pimeloyl-ACP methyl ester carboxylesterase
MRYALLIFAAWIFCANATEAGQDSVKLASLDVTVWSQRAEANVKQPVVIFSHGFHGCATQSRFLIEAFAADGYLVFAPNHRDATCNGGKGSRLSRAEIPFREPGKWSESTYRDRADDIRRLVAAIGTDNRFRAGADLSRIALAGHSLGGYTVLGLAGAWPNWKLPGVKAVLALSPYSQPFLLHGTLAGLSAPVMYQGGTRDFGITPAIQKTSGAYDQSPVPKYFVEFDKAGHLAWADVGMTAHEEIVAYSLAFMNHYVKGEPAKPSLTKKMSGVALIRYASEFGKN